MTAPVASPIKLIHPVQDKNFYFISCLERNPRVIQDLANDQVLISIAKAKQSALHEAFLKGGFGTVEPLESLKFSADEVNHTADELQSLSNQTASLKEIVLELRRSGCYQRDAALSDGQFVAQAWRECAQGINSIIDVYGLQSKASRTPSIDKPLYEAKNVLFGAMVKNVCGVIEDDPESRKAFFSVSLALADKLLEVQLRDEAGRFEPLDLGENAGAVRRAKPMDWKSYPYSVIVIPGFGPEEPQVHLSPIGKLSLELAARRFHAHVAPFIITSGGYTHPMMTPYCEAYEMKKSLIRDFGVPADAIIIDPHARHTTTNLRNAARLMYRYGIPFEKRGLIVTNTYQSSDIEAHAFYERCQGVFGFQPSGQYKRTGPFDLEFSPNLVSLSIDPLDPLDP